MTEHLNAHTNHESTKKIHNVGINEHVEHVHGKIIPEVIKPISSPVEAEEHLLSQVLESSEKHTNKKKKLSVKIIEAIVSFEESHPWVFFFITATIIFFIIIGILSAILGNGEEEVVTETPQEQQLEIIPEEVIPQPIEEKIEGSLEGVLISNILLEPGNFDTLVFHKDETFLGTYFENSQKLQIIIQIDIQGLLPSQEDKEAVLNEYLQTLENATKIVESDSMNLTNLIIELKVEQKTSKEKLREDKTILDQSYSIGGPIEINEKTRIYNEDLQKVSDIENKLNVANILKDIYKKQISSANARIYAIKQNYQAIIQGIKVIPIEGSGIQLIAKPEVKEGEILPKGAEVPTISSPGQYENIPSEDSNSYLNIFNENQINRVLNRSLYLRE